MARSFWQSEDDQRAIKLFHELLLDGHPWNLDELVDTVADRLGYSGADQLAVEVFWGQIISNKKYVFLDGGTDTLALKEKQDYDQLIEKWLTHMSQGYDYSPDYLIGFCAGKLKVEEDTVWAALMRLKNRSVVGFLTFVVVLPKK